MSHPPGVLDGGMGGYELVGERQGNHIEISQSEYQVASFCSSAHEFRNLPCLSGAVAKIRVIGLPFIRRVKMGAENFGDIALVRAHSDLGTSNAFSNIPIPSEECRGSPIQRVPKHTGLDNWPFRKDG